MRSLLLVSKFHVHTGLVWSAPPCTSVAVGMALALVCSDWGQIMALMGEASSGSAEESLGQQEEGSQFIQSMENFFRSQGKVTGIGSQCTGPWEYSTLTCLKVTPA